MCILYHKYAWYLAEVSRGVISPGTGLMVMNHLVSVRYRNCSLEEQQVLLTTKPSLQTLPIYLNQILCVVIEVSFRPSRHLSFQMTGVGTDKFPLCDKARYATLKWNRKKKCLYTYKNKHLEPLRWSLGKTKESSWQFTPFSSSKCYCL